MDLPRRDGSFLMSRFMTFFISAAVRMIRSYSSTDREERSRISRPDRLTAAFVML